MTRLTDFLVPAEPANRHRHADPPNLWLGVLAGSLAIHLLLAFSLRWWSLRVAIAQPESSNIPIELVDVDPEATASSSTTAAPATTTAQAPATATAAANNEAATLETGVTVLTPESSAPSVPLAASPSPNPSPDLSESAQLSPANSQTTLPFTPPVLPSSAPSPNQDTSPNPVPPTNNTQSPALPDTNDSTLPSSNAPLNEPQQPDGNLPAPPEPTNPNQDTSGGTPGTPDSTNAESESETANNPTPLPSGTSEPGEAPTNNGPDDVTAQVPVSENAVPAQFQASLKVSAPVNNRDIHDQLAQPKTDNQTFFSDASASACLLVPEQLRSFGQPVLLSIAIDEQGHVIGGGVRESSGNGAYDQLALCLMNTWEFTPAADVEGGSPSPVTSNLDVQVVINRV
jgi:TonB family protein